MSPLRLELALCTIISSRRLRLSNRRWRLETDIKVDMCAIGDATLDTSRVIRLGRELWSSVRPRWRTGNGDEGVVVQRSWDLAPAEAGTNGEGFRRWDAHHGVCQQGFHLIETGLPETAGNVADDAGNSAADAVFTLLELGDHALHSLCGIFVRATDRDEGVDGFAVDGVDEGEELVAY